MLLAQGLVEDAILQSGLESMIRSEREDASRQMRETGRIERKATIAERYAQGRGMNAVGREALEEGKKITRIGLALNVLGTVGAQVATAYLKGGEKPGAQEAVAPAAAPGMEADAAFELKSPGVTDGLSLGEFELEGPKAIPSQADTSAAEAFFEAKTPDMQTFDFAETQSRPVPGTLARPGEFALQMQAPPPSAPMPTQAQLLAPKDPGMRAFQESLDSGKLDQVIYNLGNRNTGGR